MSRWSSTIRTCAAESIPATGAVDRIRYARLSTAEITKVYQAVSKGHLETIRRHFCRALTNFEHICLLECGLLRTMPDEVDHADEDEGHACCRRGCARHHDHRGRRAGRRPGRLPSWRLGRPGWRRRAPVRAVR